MKKIGILGCGWLGFSLGKELIALGFEVAGTSRSYAEKKKFKQANIEHVAFQLGEKIAERFFEDISLLIISLPITNKISEEQQDALLNSIKHSAKNNLQIIFTSSISVYIDNQKEIDETSGKINKHSPNYRFEQKLLKAFTNNVTILRLGGLIGEDRHPIFHLAGKSDLANGTAPVNLVHRSDVISMIKSIIGLKKFGHIYNCVYPYHPKKKDYYYQKSIQFQLNAPNYNDFEECEKIVVSKNAQQFLNFDFQFPI